ncbi:NlpC/P60 family protein [Candidatus Poribacteria bacterium]|nr:NlpC/P60 family protein [Candidatus Poribacteria bacterium]
MEISMIMKYVGIPYKHQGRDMNGLDCWGLIKLVYKENLGIEIWDINADYSEDWCWEGKDYFIENYQKQWERVKNPSIFDVVLINNGRGTSNHAGVMLGNNMFIHCVKAGVVISKITDKMWKDKITGIFRFKAPLKE